MMTLLLLLAGHAVCDYPLQGDFLARGKNHKLGRCVCGKEIVEVKKGFWAAGPEVCVDNHWHKPLLPGVPWYQCLLAHSLIHSGAVLLITHSLWIALAELVIHAATDYAKCDGRISFNVDQAIHYGCKAAWAALVFKGIS
jgi:hypothetical protein